MAAMACIRSCATVSGTMNYAAYGVVAAGIQSQSHYPYSYTNPVPVRSTAYFRRTASGA